MHERKRQERRDQQHGNKRRTQPRHRRQQDQVERRGVPQRWKPAEIIVVGFHLAVGEIERPGNHDDQTRRHRQHFRQIAAGGDRKGRHEHVGDEIDDEVEALAVPARQDFRDLEAARHRPVDGIDHQRQSERQEHRRPVTTRSEDERQQAERRAERGEDVDSEGAQHRKIHDIFFMRMILSEKRFPLFGIMRY